MSTDLLADWVSFIKTLTAKQKVGILMILLRMISQVSNNENECNQQKSFDLGKTYFAFEDLTADFCSNYFKIRGFKLPVNNNNYII